MASVRFKGIDAYQDMLAGISEHTRDICKHGAYAGAEIVADAVKAECPVSEGDLRDSIGLSRMEDDDGFVHTKLGFAGYDRNGHPNIVKARVIESGASNHQKNPFVRRAVNRVKKQAQNAMAEAVTQAIDKLSK